MTMETQIKIYPIGNIRCRKNSFFLEIHEEFRTGLKNLEGFSHLQVVWWGTLFDTPQYRKTLVTKKPYKHSPEELGIFATRSPVRPNPILITTVFMQGMDLEKGVIHTPYIDAEDNTPILDIKPYHLFERVQECYVPEWCSHWPGWYEESATFNWEEEFNF
jgi:tRNA-Thr(GGU) m(6)t(6)A37 methyltransferase TsaA